MAIELADTSSLPNEFRTISGRASEAAERIEVIGLVRERMRHAVALLPDWPVKYDRVTCSRSMMTYRVRRPLIVAGSVAGTCLRST